MEAVLTLKQWKHALNIKKYLSIKKVFAKFFKKTRKCTYLIVIAPDHHGLFSKISGIVSSCGIDIVSAKILQGMMDLPLILLLFKIKVKNL